MLCANILFHQGAGRPAYQSRFKGPSIGLLVAGGDSAQKLRKTEYLDLLSSRIHLSDHRHDARIQGRSAAINIKHGPGDPSRFITC